MTKPKPLAAVPGHSRGSRLLHLWRSRSHLTQRDACGGAYLDLDQGQYSALETGRSRPSLRRATLIQDRTGGAVPAVSWMEPDPGDLVEQVEARAS